MAIAKRRLGRTNLMVSAISLGTVELGMRYGIAPVGQDEKPGEEQAARLLNRALDLGVNYIDTARAYGDSEAIIGRSIAARREEFVLASKVPPFHLEGLTPKELRKRAGIAVEDSLRALKTDVIDIMMIHCAPDREFGHEVLLDTLDAGRMAGRIRFIGASVYGEDAALKAILSGRCDVIQVAYSVLDRRPESRVLPAAMAHDVGIVARSVLLKGALTYRASQLPDSLAELKDAAMRMEAAADSMAGGLPELAYRYVLAHQDVHTALVGTGRIEELEAAVGYAGRGELPAETLARIREVAVRDERLLNPGNWSL
ncbi:MAG TPA: aldo/keto reductase [Bryobacteraceae bacterium]|nr:aldo/keto reductase [Bryobacteraceae bacterium]